MQAHRDEFFHACGRHNIAVRVARTILRHAGTIQRSAEADCSVSAQSVRDQHAKRETAARNALAKVSKDSHWQIRFAFQGDPRGCMVRIVTESCPDGFEVPGVGLTAAQIERLCAVEA